DDAAARVAAGGVVEAHPLEAVGIDGDAGLLGGLADGRLGGGLARVDVPARQRPGASVRGPAAADEQDIGPAEVGGAPDDDVGGVGDQVAVLLGRRGGGFGGAEVVEHGRVGLTGASGGVLALDLLGEVGADVVDDVDVRGPVVPGPGLGLGGVDLADGGGAVAAADVARGGRPRLVQADRDAGRGGRGGTVR